MSPFVRLRVTCSRLRKFFCHLCHLCYLCHLFVLLTPFFTGIVHVNP